MVNVVPCHVKADFPSRIVGENGSKSNIQFSGETVPGVKWVGLVRAFLHLEPDIFGVATSKGVHVGDDDRTSEHRRSTSWPHRQDSFDSFSLCEIKDLQQHCRAIRSPLLRLCSFVRYSCLRFVAFFRHKKVSSHLSRLISAAAEHLHSLIFLSNMGGCKVVRWHLFPCDLFSVWKGCQVSPDLQSDTFV